MTHTKVVNGQVVSCTPEEIAEIEARDAAWVTGQAERDRIAHNAPILAEIAALDAKRIRSTAEVSLALALQTAPAQLDLDKLSDLTAQISILRSQLL